MNNITDPKNNFFALVDLGLYETVRIVYPNDMLNHDFVDYYIMKLTRHLLRR